MFSFESLHFCIARRLYYSLIAYFSLHPPALETQPNASHGQHLGLQLLLLLSRNHNRNRARPTLASSASFAFE